MVAADRVRDHQVLADHQVPADHVRDLVVPADHARDLVVPADLADLERDLVAQEVLVVLVAPEEVEVEVLDQMVVVVLALTTDRLLAGEADEVRQQFRQSRNPGF